MNLALTRAELEEVAVSHMYALNRLMPDAGELLRATSLRMALRCVAASVEDFEPFVAKAALPIRWAVAVAVTADVGQELPMPMLRVAADVFADGGTAADARRAILRRFGRNVDTKNVTLRQLATLWGVAPEQRRQKLMDLLCDAVDDGLTPAKVAERYGLSKTAASDGMREARARLAGTWGG